MPAALSPAEHQQLLQLARQAITAVVNGQPVPQVEPASLPATLQEPRACFVTLTEGGELRGCIGGLFPEVPLYQEVLRRAAQAATDDYRFGPVRPAELPRLHIEISVLTVPQALPYVSPGDLPRHLRPGQDGVTLRYRFHRATFLPQVWETVPDPEEFLSRLCDKMGEAPDLWRHTKLAVETYAVEMFEEGKQ